MAPESGLPSQPTCRGAGPLQVLKTRGFAGDSRQASPVRPVYNADQPITALKGTGFEPSVPRKMAWLPRLRPKRTRFVMVDDNANDMTVFEQKTASDE